jgi:secreted trypsin-like serine protease
MTYPKRFITWSMGLVLVGFLAACGGGGGDSTDDVSSVTATNTCANLGLVSKSLVVPKLINGTECATAEASPLVMLFATGPDGRTALCTGTMITPQKVLTAGHCLSGRVALDVLYGTPSGVYASQRAASWTVHPGFSYVNGQIVNDVAVAVLATPLAVSTLPILVSLAPAPGMVGSVFGYGTAGTATNDYGILRSGTTAIDVVTDTAILSLYDGSRSNTCHGDSGGPLLIQAAGQQGIIGLTSAGTSEACAVGDWTSFTKIQNGSIRNFLQTVAPDARYF